MNLLTLSLPLLAAALPATPPASNPPPNFSVMAIRSASPIHYLQMNAAGQKFYLGGSTASYCPSQVPHCPPGNQTVFTPNGASLVSPTQPNPRVNNLGKTGTNYPRTSKYQAVNKSTSTPTAL